MAVARRNRTIAASQQELWELIADPEHMPRWWPGVMRMEGVHEDRFTQVFTTKRGKPVRIDFQVVTSDPPSLQVWEQEIPGTPFERVLSESFIELRLAAAPGGTTVTLEQHQKLKGYSRTGGFLLKRATATKLDEALDGLERIFG